MNRVPAVVTENRERLSLFELEKLCQALEGRAKYIVGRYKDYEEANLLMDIRRKILRFMRNG